MLPQETLKKLVWNKSKQR